MLATPSAVATEKIAAKLRKLIGALGGSGGISTQSAAAAPISRAPVSSSCIAVRLELGAPNVKRPMRIVPRKP